MTTRKCKILYIACIIFLLYNAVLEDRKSMLMGDCSKSLNFYDTDIQGLYGNTKEGFPNHKREFSKTPHRR